MKWKRIFFLFILFLSFLSFPVYAGQKTVTFSWEQPGLVVGDTDFYGWKMFYSETAGGPYQQLDGDIVWDGTAQPEYQWTSVPIEVPNGQQKTFYFVVNAWDKAENYSEDSNEVSLVIDFLAPSQPVVTSPIPAVTNNSNFAIQGTKSANSSIWINGTEVVPINSQTSWNFTYVLVEGMNNLSISSKDSAGNESTVLLVQVRLDTMAPPIPIKLEVTFVP